MRQSKLERGEQLVREEIDESQPTRLAQVERERRGTFIAGLDHMAQASSGKSVLGRHRFGCPTSVTAFLGGVIPGVNVIFWFLRLFQARD